MPCNPIWKARKILVAYASEVRVDTETRDERAENLIRA